MSSSWIKRQNELAALEQNRELVRQYVRDSNLNQLSKAMMQAMVDRCWTQNELKALCKSYHIQIFEKEWAMTKEEEVKLLKEQMNALSKKIEKLEHGKWGKEPTNGAMLKIEKTFYQGGAKYKYLAIKEGGVWHLTGTSPEAKKTYTWETLKAFAGSRARVWRLTVAEELLD
jgi:polyhydroxyalkanoate synthesis regulator phasin